MMEKNPAIGKYFKDWLVIKLLGIPYDFIQYMNTVNLYGILCVCSLMQNTNKIFSTIYRFIYCKNCIYNWTENKDKSNF